MLAWLERNQLLVFAAACIVFVSSVALSMFGADEPPPLSFRDDSVLAPGTPIRVHVTGAVASPGVYKLREGDRVVDALAAAGGPNADADTEALNLARRLRDEEQILVSSRRGRAPEPPAALVAGERLNINSATQAQLDQLPGIGEAYSRRIVDSRTVDGRFKTTDELVARRVIPRATFERIRDLISVEP